MFNKVSSRSYCYFLEFSFFLVEKWIPPSKSETAEIGQKIEGILVVKVAKLNLIGISKDYIHPFPCHSTLAPT